MIPVHNQTGYTGWAVMQDLPSQTVISAIVEDEEHNQIIISLLITAKWVN